MIFDTQKKDGKIELYIEGEFIDSFDSIERISNRIRDILTSVYKDIKE